MKKNFLTLICLLLSVILMFASCGNKSDDNLPTVETTEIYKTEPSVDLARTKIEIVGTEHEHSYLKEIITPTCTSNGYTLYICECGEKYEAEKKEYSGHVWGEWKIVKKATISAQGLERRECYACKLAEVKTVEKEQQSLHNHLYKSEVVAPTCKTEGYTKYLCACGKTYKDEYMDASGHSLKKETVVSLPTCLKEGVEIYKCINCNYEESRIIDMAEHNYKAVITEPTCTNEGFTTYTCCVCEKSYIDNYVAVLEHTFSLWEVVDKSTCVKTGIELRNCTKCNFVETREILEGCHNYEAEITLPTCTEKGYTTYICAFCGDNYIDDYVDACGHEIEILVVDPTCTEQGYTIETCCVCKDSAVGNYVDMTEHSLNDWAITEFSTCTTEGIKYRNCVNCDYFETQTIDVLAHNYESKVKLPTCTEQGFTMHICATCQDSYIDEHTKALGHLFGNWVTVADNREKESEQSFEQRTCLDCNYFETRPILINEHDYKSIVAEPTCTSKGYEQYTCSKCGDMYIGKYINALPHSYEEVKIPPTCNNQGYTKHTCSVCNDSYIDNYVNATSHSMFVIDIKEPSCLSKGCTTYRCSKCQFIQIEYTSSALGHNYEYSYKTRPTCTRDGYLVKQCRCGAKITSVTMKKLPHKYVSKKIAPTCESDGYTKYTCVGCGDSFVKDKINKLNHNYVDDVIMPTCTTKGYTKHVCLKCGISYVDSETEMTGHNYGSWVTIKESTICSEGIAERICSICENVETKSLPKSEIRKDIVAYYKVVDGVVIDLVSGSKMSDAAVDGNYFSGGTVNLPSSYNKATIEAIMVYNRISTDSPIGNGLSYYGGAFLFQEALNPSNTGYIKVPFGGGQIGTVFSLKTSLNYNNKVLKAGDSYWCLAFDEAENKYALQINDSYVEKSHWANYINKSFKLSSEHKFKEFIVYSSRLTPDEMNENFQKTGISLLSNDATIIGRVTNGITNLGSAFAFSKTGIDGIPKWHNTNILAGNYSVDDGNGLILNYSISDYVEPDKGIDNSQYESLHIIKKPETLYLGYKYALSAVPYPFNVNHNGISDQYDVLWESSDTSIAVVIDGLVIPKRTGVVTITAKLRNTEVLDSCTIKIAKKKALADNILYISENYVSSNGFYFSTEDYEMTTNAIYDAITEAYEAGYNHIIFPQIDFYAAPTKTEYYIPTGMTVEFPKGSAFYMMPNAIGKTDGYTYFRMGWGWWSCNIPTEKASVEKDANDNILAYYCRDAHLIIDKYYGEFYNKDATMSELSAGANEYSWSCVFLNIGKRAEYCSVEIHEANCPTGFFILMGGKGNSEVVNGNGGSVSADSFVSGWLDDTGTLVENRNWISTINFFTVAKSAANGMDTLHEYYIGDWEHNVTTATQHLYDILWYDEEYNLISADRWQYVDEGYIKPDGARYFKLSIQQSELPSGTNEYVRLCPDEPSRFCEIKNTNIINGADGLASVVGATEACWIHDNYVSNDGLLRGSCWALDLEDGWQGMRGTIIEHNILRKYTYSPSIGDYRGMDTGVLALASGYNTFVISNYLGAINQSNYNVVNTHIINNVIYTMYSSISNSTSVDIRPKIYAHVYYNIIQDENIKELIASNGFVYRYGNSSEKAINKW